jgi:hypothetical protein
MKGIDVLSMQLNVGEFDVLFNALRAGARTED